MIKPIVPHPSDPSLALVPLTRGMFATIDAAYAVQVGAFNWSAFKSRPSSQVTYGRRRDTGSGEYILHRFIASLAGISLAQSIDHKNRNGLDCRAANLRSASGTENQANRGTQRNNTSGFAGVMASGNRWVAVVQVRGSRVHCGSFGTREEAAVAADAARVELFGEFAPTN